MKAAVRYLERRLKGRVEEGVILGSGLGAVDLGSPGVEIPYGRIPGWPAGRVGGHPGRLSQIGRLLVLRGRTHLYEGRTAEEVARPVRVLARLGVRRLVLTNAAGAVRKTLRTGDLMRIEDHLNLTGDNPLRGVPRFVDLSSAWDPELGRRLDRAAKRRRLPLRRGVYAALPGPSYETPAEVRMLRALGADAVGMSTVPEAIAAADEGIRVAGLSVITNAAGPVSHGGVLEATARAAGRVGLLLREFFSQGPGGRKPSR